MEKILVINTGSTSTKIALYEDGVKTLSDNMTVPLEVLGSVKRNIDQLPYRLQSVIDWTEKNGINVSELNMVAARGGTVPEIEGGAYVVDDHMEYIAKYFPISPHESSMSCVIANQLREKYGVPGIIYDACNTDEAASVAKMTGLPGVKISTRGHPLNARKAARTVAERMGIDYRKSCFIVIHLGGSISVGAHKNGRIIDMSNAFCGPMSPQRAGRIPSDELIKMCYSGKYTQAEITKLIHGKGGLMAYFGTQNAAEVFKMADEGNELAKSVLDAMAYQVSKAAAEMRVALEQDADCIVFTGGMAHSERFVKMIYDRISFLGPYDVVPGEMEMDALAEGAHRVLIGEEEAKIYAYEPPTKVEG